jgi:hypothetical protein
VSVGHEPEREQQRQEEQALEEIRLLFARYRRAAGHGMVTEHERPAQPRATRSEEDAPTLLRR